MRYLSVRQMTRICLESGLPEANLYASDTDRVALVRSAALTLQISYKELAGSEALIRALLHERSNAVQEALFWLDVYKEHRGRFI